MFNRNTSCRDCELGGAARSVCIPTRLHSGVQPQQSDKALLIVAQSPGPQEDHEDSNMVGRAGQCLTNVYLRPGRISDLADIFFANAVRCYVQPGSTVKKGWVKACHKYLESDIDNLQVMYREVVILCLGAAATSSVFGCSLSDAFKKQGTSVQWGDLGEGHHAWITKTFATYHPSHIDRPSTHSGDGRGQPHLIASVAGHMSLLRSYLMDGNPRFKWSTAKVKRFTTPDEALDHTKLEMLSLDTETYGFVAGYPKQTMFHPKKMVTVDGVRPQDILQSIALTWRVFGTPGQREGLQSTFLPWGSRSQRVLTQWILRLYADGGTLLGQNLPFDLQVLRFSWPPLRKLLSPPLRIFDLAIMNSLDDPERPEKSLKDLSMILGFGAYKEKTEKTDDRYPNRYDETLGRYNIEDTEKTFLCCEALSHFVNMNKYTGEFYSDVLWSIVEMSEAGLQLDEDGLRQYDGLLQKGVARIKEASVAGGVLAGGKGSVKSKRDFITRCFKLSAVTTAPSLTEKTREIQVTNEQIKTLLDEVPKHTSDHLALRRMAAVAKLSKLQTTFTGPLLRGGKRSGQMACRLIKGRAYPTWYPVPTTMKDEGGAVGGTRQARIVCRQPALQTCPSRIKKFWKSRFKDGRLLSIDASQIELRVAALLSGDKPLLDEFVREVDLHTSTALLFVEKGIIPWRDYEQKPKFWRAVGKEANFGLIYRIGPAGLVNTIHRRTGAIISTGMAKDIIDIYFKKHPRLWSWQEELIHTACTERVLHLPLVQVVRKFEGSATTIVSTYLNEIVNFPSQGTAALIVLSAQAQLHQYIRDHKLRARVVLNIYDSLYIDTPHNEVRLVRAGFPLLFNPPYLRDLCDLVGRTIPFTWEEN